LLFSKSGLLHLEILLTSILRQNLYPKLALIFGRLSAKRFSVSRAIIYIWLKLESLSPQKTGPKGHTKLQAEKLKQLIEEKPDAYLDELAVELNVSAFTVAYGLQRLGISRKKKHAVPGKKRGGTQQISAGSRDIESC
jgi:transposase